VTRKKAFLDDNKVGSPLAGASRGDACQPFAVLDLNREVGPQQDQPPSGR
jgi:hypothetical protein